MIVYDSTGLFVEYLGIFGPDDLFDILSNEDDDRIDEITKQKILKELEPYANAYSSDAH